MAVAEALPLFRALLRASRSYDTNPSLRLLLAAPRTSEFDMCQASWTPLSCPPARSHDALAARTLANAVVGLNEGARLYTSPRNKFTFRSAIREAVRETLSDGPQKLLPDAAFTLLRKLEAGVSLGERVLAPSMPSSTGGWPALRATSDGPAKGDVLVSHPLLRRDTVLLLGADGLDGYAFGLVTNAPTTAQLAATPFSGRGQQVGPAKSPARGFTTGGRVLDDEVNYDEV